MQIRSGSRLKGLIKPAFSSFWNYSEHAEDPVARKEVSGLMHSLIKNNENLAIVEKLFENLEKDLDGLVCGPDFVKAFFCAGNVLERKAFENKVCEYFKVEDIGDCKVRAEDCLGLFFSNKKDSKIVEGLRRFLRPRKMNSMLPGVKHVNKSGSPIRFKVFRSFAFSHIEDNSASQYFQLLGQWWDELSKGHYFVGSSEFISFIVKKGIFEVESEAEKLCNKSFDIVTKVDFFEVFVIGVLRSQLVEISRKVNLQRVSKSFLPSYRKISNTKNKIMLKLLPLMK